MIKSIQLSSISFTSFRNQWQATSEKQKLITYLALGALLLLAAAWIYRKISNLKIKEPHAQKKAMIDKDSQSAVPPPQDDFTIMTGQKKDGKLEGYCVIKHKDNKISTGVFHKGKLMEGMGKLELTLGDYYGDVKTGQPNGNGSFEDLEGVVSRGVFVNGNFTCGEQERGNAIYKGIFVNFYLEGTEGCSKTVLNGPTYTGTFIKGRLCGYGKIKLEGGDEIVGRFEKDELVSSL